MLLRFLQTMVTTQRSNSYKGSYCLAVPNVAKAFECSSCGYVLRDDRDLKSFFETSACSECADTYYYPNVEKWNAGWRPNLNEVKNDV